MVESPPPVLGFFAENAAVPDKTAEAEVEPGAYRTCEVSSTVRDPSFKKPETAA